MSSKTAGLIRQIFINQLWEPGLDSEMLMNVLFLSSEQPNSLEVFIIPVLWLERLSSQMLKVYDLKNNKKFKIMNLYIRK